MAHDVTISGKSDKRFVIFPFNLTPGRPKCPNLGVRITRVWLY